MKELNGSLGLSLGRGGRPRSWWSHSSRAQECGSRFWSFTGRHCEPGSGLPHTSWVLQRSKLFTFYQPFDAHDEPLRLNSPPHEVPPASSLIGMLYHFSENCRRS